MFNGYFYHAITRKTVAVFGTLFNNITIARKDANDNYVDIQKVPLAYGPRQKFLDRIDQQSDLSDPKVAIKLPRISFEITNMQYDSLSAGSMHNKIVTAQTTTSRTEMYSPVPYLIDMQLNILAKNQDDALQILEQILPTFRPTYTVSANMVDGAPSIDIPITLQSVSLLDDYQGDMTTRRVLMYTLDFQMKVRYYGLESSTNVINKASVDINNLTNMEFMEEITVTDTTLTIDNVDDNT